MIQQTKSILALTGLLFAPQLQAQVHFVSLPENFEPDIISSDGRVAYGALMESASSYSLAEWTLRGGIQTLAPSMPLLSFVDRSRFLQASDDGLVAVLSAGDQNGVLSRGGYFYNSATGLTAMQPILHSDGVASGSWRIGALSGDGSLCYGDALKICWPSVCSWTVRWHNPGTPEAYCGEWPNDCSEHVLGANFDASEIVAGSLAGTTHTDSNGTATVIPMGSFLIKVSGDASTVYGDDFFSDDGQMWSLATGLVNLSRPALTSSVRPIAVNLDGSVSFWEADGTAYRWTQGSVWHSMEEYLIALGATSLGAGDYQLAEVLAYGNTGKTALASVCRAGTTDCQTVVIYMEDAPPGSVGSNYCGPMPRNSTGASSSLRATGSASLANNNLIFEAEQLPPNQFGILLNSVGQDYSPFLAGSAGTLCIGGFQVVVRHDRAQDIARSDSNGGFAIPIDTTALPGPVGSIIVQSGETYHFQVWHRDWIAGASTTNFTNAVSVLFQ